MSEVLFVTALEDFRQSRPIAKLIPSGYSDYSSEGLMPSWREGRTVAVASETSFGDRLRVLREQAGMSQYELARRANITRQTMSALEKGSNEPNWTTVRALARALGVSVAAFDVEPSAEDQPAPEASPRPRPMGKGK